MQGLKSQFEIPGLVQIEEGQGGLEKVVVTSPLASAEIYLHGAHVAHFQPAGQDPVLWMSKWSLFARDKPIRGGVPICFPWFGPRADDPKAPAHGLVRQRDWSLKSTSASDGAVIVTMSLKLDDMLVQHIINVSSTLEMKLEVSNTSGNSLRFEEALHSYFTIGDIRQTSVEGLGGVTYIDKVGTVTTRRQTDPVIRFTGETDRVYQDTTATCVINDPVMKRKIEVAKSGSNSTVVWNPWIAKAKAMPDFGDDEWPGMLCIETANVGKNAIELASGQAHKMTARVRVG